MEQRVLFKDEDKILLLCARTEKTPKIKSDIKKLLYNDLEWDYLTQIASEHKLLPLLYWNLKEFKEEVPEKILKSLKLNFNRNAKNNLLMFGELITLLKLFDNEDVIAIPYKGPILAILAYKNLVLRQFDDLDILVNKNNILKVKQILISHGYTPQFDLGGFKERRFIQSQREYKFFNSENKINLEIQWQFEGVSFSVSGDLGFTDTKNIETIEINNKRISALSPENMLLILCIHASGHHWERLSWICDVSELIQSNKIDWEYTIKKADELGIKRTLWVNLFLAVDLLGLNIPDDINKHLESKNIQNLGFIIKKRLFIPYSNDFFRSAGLRLKIREKRSHQIKDCLKIMFLPTNEEWDKSINKSFLPPFSYFYRFIQVLSD